MAGFLFRLETADLAPGVAEAANHGGKGAPQRCFRG